MNCPWRSSLCLAVAIRLLVRHRNDDTNLMEDENPLAFLWPTLTLDISTYAYIRVYNIRVSNW